MNLGCLARAEMIGPEHDRQGRAEGSIGIGKEARHTCECFFPLCIEDMQDDADEQRVRLVDPVPEIAELSLRVHENVGNILDIPHLAGTPPNFHQRIEMRRGDIGRIEPQAMREF